MSTSSVYNGNYYNSTYGCSTYYRGIYESASSSWTGISSKITSEIRNYNQSSHTMVDTLSVADTSTSGLLGYTNPRKYYLFFEVSASANEDWNHADVTIYANQMDAYNMTDAQKISNATHEIGHALKLAHPTTQQSAVMNQGIQSIGPTSYDNNQLISKWGY